MGAAVGPAVGMAVGANEGRFVGDTEGTPVGEKVGPAVGTKLGAPVGACEGISVGMDVMVLPLFELMAMSRAVRATPRAMTMVTEQHTVKNRRQGRRLLRSRHRLLSASAISSSSSTPKSSRRSRMCTYVWVTGCLLPRKRTPSLQ